jgi:hypothetical protein
LVVASELLETGSTLREEVGSYIAGIMARFTAGPKTSAVAEGSLAEELFKLLTGRQFCRLSRARAAHYRERALRSFDECLQRGEPLSFSYDIGPGYHATLLPGEQGLSFDVGLSEVLLLNQVTSFCDRVVALYPPGAHFWLVVDNLCGLWTNDIAVERTTGYCTQLRALIRALNLEHRIEVLVESEQFDLAEYGELFSELEERPLASTPSEDDVENVERFLGRRCNSAEAAQRIDRYRRATIVTEKLLASVVRGIRMTQRASAATLGFRPFPGGDARTQCGEVAITRSVRGHLRPILLTSRNVDNYDQMHFHYPEHLPAPVSRVTYAAQLPPDQRWPRSDNADQAK